VRIRAAHHRICCLTTGCARHPLLCGMAPLMPQCDRGAARACPAPLSLALGRCDPARSVACNLCASAARSLLKGKRRRGSGRQGRAAGLRQPAVRPACGADCAHLPARSAATRRRYAALSSGCACFFWPIFCAFVPFGSSTPRLFRLQPVYGSSRSGTGGIARAIGVRKQKIGRQRQAAPLDPS
jgi:hypothetical protein